MGAQVNYRNPPLNFCLLHLSLLIEGFDCGLPWAIKTLWKSKGWLVLLLLVCHITVLVLWIPCSLAIFSRFSLRALCFHSESSQLGFFLKFRVLHFFLIQISGVQYCVFVLNWKHQTYSVVKQLFWSCACSGFLSVSFLQGRLVVLDLGNEEMHPLFRHLYCFRQRFCRAGDIRLSS